eukprot:gene6414-12968_t
MSSTYSVLNCCDQFQSPKSLLDCVKRYVNESNYLNSKSTISLITFTDAAISNYSAYSLAINAAYASLNGYIFYIIDETEGFQLDQFDARWNKVKILYNAMDPTINRFAATTTNDTLVWIDADLIFLDFKLLLQDVVNLYPSVNIIISRDKDDSPTIANTGLIIIKNNEWSRNFLSLWWNSYDRSKCCDQNVLTWLYNSDPSLQPHFKLLPADALNTDFPCWKNQKPTNQVLHLAGASSLLRRSAFTFGWDCVCRTITSSLSSSTQQLDLNMNMKMDLFLNLPLQLQLTRERLVEFVLTLPVQRMIELLELNRSLEHVVVMSIAVGIDNTSSNKKNNNHNNGNVVYIRRIRDVQSRLEDILKTDDAEQEFLSSSITASSTSTSTSTNLNVEQLSSSQLSLSTQSVVIHIREWIFQSLFKIWTPISCITATSDGSSSSSSDTCSEASNGDYDGDDARLETIREAISAGYELVFSLIGDDEMQRRRRKELLFGDIFTLLLAFEVEVEVHENLKHRFHYYDFKYREILGHEFQHTNTTRSILHFKQAYRAWKAMEALNYFGSVYVTAEPYKEGLRVMHTLGSMLCMHNQHQRGQRMLLNALEYHEKTLQIFEGNVLVTASMRKETELSFAESLLNLGLCHYYDTKSTRSIAVGFLTKAVSLYEKYEYSNSEGCQSAQRHIQQIQEEVMHSN